MLCRPTVRLIGMEARGSAQKSQIIGSARRIRLHRAPELRPNRHACTELLDGNSPNGGPRFERRPMTCRQSGCVKTMATISAKHQAATAPDPFHLLPTKEVFDFTHSSGFQVRFGARASAPGHRLRHRVISPDIFLFKKPTQRGKMNVERLSERKADSQLLKMTCPSCMANRRSRLGAWGKKTGSGRPVFSKALHHSVTTTTEAAIAVAHIRAFGCAVTRCAVAT